MEFRVYGLKMLYIYMIIREMHCFSLILVDAFDLLIALLFVLFNAFFFSWIVLLKTFIFNDQLLGSNKCLSLYFCKCCSRHATTFSGFAI